MATSVEYIEFVCDQIREVGDVRSKKMFGEYTVYINDKPVLLVCDNTVFVKKLDEIATYMQGAQVGFPYEGAKERYVLDVENTQLAKAVLSILIEIVPLPKAKKKQPKAQALR